MKLAIFDFDGTIYKHETFDLFMKHLKLKHPKQYQHFFIKILPIYMAYKCKLVKEMTMKHKVMHQFSLALQTLSLEDQDAFFNDIYEKMQADFNLEVLKKLAETKEKYDTVLLLSGAYTPLLEIVAKHLNIEHYIGTDLPQSGQDTDHIHGDRKLSKLEASFNGQTIDWENSIAFADSASDINLLEKVGTAIAVSPDKILSAHAHKHQWYIIS